MWLFFVASVFLLLSHERSSVQMLRGDGMQILNVVLVGTLGWASLTLSLLWLRECRLLRTSSTVIGGLQADDPESGGRKAIYQFPDRTGQHQVGHLSREKRHDDNAVVVFYDSANPRRNVSHRSLRFHRVQLSLQTAQKAQAE
jgi:hypothetical protein